MFLRQLLSSLLLLNCAVPVFSCELPAPLKFTAVGEGVYVHEGVHEDINSENCGDIANIGFIIGSRSVAVIDPGGSPSIGRQVSNAVKRATKLPISHVVVTHFHPDHLLGGVEISDDVTITVVAHKNYARALAQRGEFYLERYSNLFTTADSVQLVQPTLEIETDGTIDLGDRILQFNAHRTAHTDNDLSVLDVKTNTLWAGDLLFHERIPSLDGSITGWIAVMGDLAALKPALVVPGHGPVATWDEIAPMQLRYLEVLRDEIRAVIKANGRLSEAVESVGNSERDKWQLFGDMHRGNVTRAFTELEWE